MTGSDFYESWLAEMPTGISSRSDQFNIVKSQIQKHIRNRSYNKFLTRDEHGAYYVIGDDNEQIYYVEVDNEIVLGVVLKIKPQALLVKALGKDPAFQNKPPFASDLYEKIIDASKWTGLVLSSDDTLTDEGYNLWKRLLSKGYTISIYDTKNPGNSFKILSQLDMDNYFKHNDTDFRRYRYVVTESNKISDLTALFEIKRTQELSGIDHNN